MELDKETINTDAGEYTVTWYHDESAEQPYDEGFALIVNGGRNRINIETVSPSATRFVPNDPVRVAHSVVMGDKSSYWDHDYRSGAALVRYMRLKGYKGVTLVSDYFPDEPSTDRFEPVHGIAWAPDDVPATHDGDDNYPATYVKLQLQQWHAWAEGDMFGYVVTGPDGAEVEDGSTWGYYGFWEGGEREYTLSEATRIAQEDAAERVKAANLVGAGIVGIV